MNHYLPILVLLFFSSVPLHAQRLKVSENGRYLVKQDGTPFFYLGDTAWELFHRLSREEADLYLRNRAEKGFTVIQAVVLAELNGLHDPNAEGEIPLVNDDPTRPNEKYFRQVDYIIDKAVSLGLYMGLLPTWGDKFNKKWGVGPEIFTPENAEVYGQFLGKRYKNKPIIWILGGDRNPDNEEDIAITDAMAKGIMEATEGKALITYHPQGGSNSATWFHDRDWLDFNMFQSGHNRIDIPNYKTTAENYQKKPVKPVLDGEPSYEDHPVDWKPEKGWFDEFNVRKSAYWSMLNGAAGHTYGNHNIWQMWEPGRHPISAARTPWWQALDYPGAFQMGYMKHLFTVRPWYQLVPGRDLVEDPAPETSHYTPAAVAEDGSFMMVYSPEGKNLKVKTDQLKDGQLQAYWYDASIGESIFLGTLDRKPLMEFDPPGDPAPGNDWVLVIDAASAGLVRP